MVLGRGETMLVDVPCELRFARADRKSAMSGKIFRSNYGETSLERLEEGGLNGSEETKGMQGYKEKTARYEVAWYVILKEEEW